MTQCVVKNCLRNAVVVWKLGDRKFHYCDKHKKLPEGIAKAVKKFNTQKTGKNFETPL